MRVSEGDPVESGEDVGVAEAAPPRKRRKRRKQPQQQQQEAAAPVQLDSDASALRELELFASQGEAEVTVERVGPLEYHGARVQVAICGTLPAGAGRLHDEIKRRWGGGKYDVIGRASDGRVLRAQLRIAGRPLPLDEEEALDEAESARGDSRDDGLLRLGIGWVWVEQQQRHVWTGPGATMGPAPMPPGQYVHEPIGEADDLRAELDRLRAEREESRMDAKISALAARIDGGGGGQQLFVQMLQNSMEQQRLQVERDREISREKAAADELRYAREREDRDRREREEREARERWAVQQQAFMTQMLEGGNKRGSLRELAEEAAAIKGLFSDDPTDGEELAQVIGAGEKAIVSAIQSFKASAPAQLTTTAANPPQSEDQALAGVLEFVLDSYRSQRSPRDTVNALVGYCRGARLDPRVTIGQLKAITHEQLLKVLGDAAGASTDEAQRALFSASREALSTEDGRAWTERMIAVAKASA